MPNPKNKKKIVDMKSSKTSKPEIENSKKKQEKELRSEKRKKRYIRTFYYSFCASFIVLGLIAILVFVYTQDKNIFGFSERYYKKAVQYEEKGEYDKAIKELISCIDYNPTYSEARLKLADIYVLQGKYSEAIALLDESIALQPRNENYYIKYISTLTKQNKITEAITFVENIPSKYIILKLAPKRPGNVITSLDAGTYDSPINISFTVPEDSSVYYTTDGSAPTTESIRYEGNPLNIANGTVTVRAFAINEAGLVSDECSATYRIYNSTTPYVFRDTKIEAIVRATLSIPDGIVYYGDLERITKFTNEVSGESFFGNIEVLDDLASMANLTDVIIKNEPKIKTFSALFSLKNVVKLELSGCEITDTSLVEALSSLIWLEDLNLNNNLITNISSLSNMIKLRNLSVSNNNIKTLEGIESLSNLTTFIASKNIINNISPLSSHPKMKTLDLSENLVQDLTSISSMSVLSNLNIAGNKLSKLNGIQRLTQIKTLNISDNPSLSDVSMLSSFISLSDLNVNGTAVSSLVSIAGIQSLVTLDISNTSITDFAFLSNLSLKNLTAANLGITNDNLNILGKLSTIQTLYINNNSITDVSALSNLKHMQVLVINGNNVDDLSPLVACSGLSNVTCSSSASSASINALKKAKITVTTIG